MKFLVCLFVIAVITAGVYFFYLPKKKSKKGKVRAVQIAAAVAIILLGLLAFLMYQSSTAPDTQCGRVHATTTRPPKTLESATDFFMQGNFDYDSGDCLMAIRDYTNSIKVDPLYPEAYNNRGYTYMRMRDYKNALPDFNRAISLKPSYMQALMNRGDLYNFYGPIINRQKAIEDYNKVITLGGTEGTSVCGHKAMAENNNVLPLVILRLLMKVPC